MTNAVDVIVSVLVFVVFMYFPSSWLSSVLSYVIILWDLHVVENDKKKPYKQTF